MNRADAIEIDEQNLNPELFCGKRALERERESIDKPLERNSKIRILLEVIETISKTTELALQKKASKKLSKLLDDI